MDLLKATLSEVSSAVAAKKISAQEVTRYFLDRISRLDAQLNAFITVNDQALEQAKAIDKKISSGEPVGPLAGVPIAVKDMLCTRGLKTTAASKMLYNFIPPYDATVVRNLKSAGAIIIGKTNQDEFAMGSSNETSYFGSVKNPWNVDYVPGGSSGGSAAAQAAKLSLAAIGTDTGGSIRQPASFCGVVGVKPTYGRVSRYGVVAYASSLDQVGPMAGSVEDAALIMETICGHDRADSTTSQRSVPQFTKALTDRSLKGLRVGIVKEYQSSTLNSDVEEAVSKARNHLQKAGAEIVEISLSLSKYAVPIYYLIAASEASSNLARYDGVKYGYRAEFKSLSGVELDAFYSKNRGEGFGKEVQRRIMIGTYALSSGYFDAYYNKACQVRRLMQMEYETAFKSCDVILSPVTATPPFKIGERISDPLTMYLNDIFTVSTNLAGLPGMSIPFGFSKEGLPIGVQLTGAHFHEEVMLRIAQWLEDGAEGSERSPHVI